jgi:hypothetical protein
MLSFWVSIECQYKMTTFCPVEKLISTIKNSPVLRDIFSDTWEETNIVLLPNNSGAIVKVKNIEVFRYEIDNEQVLITCNWNVCGSNPHYFLEIIATYLDMSEFYPNWNSTIQQAFPYYRYTTLHDMEDAHVKICNVMIEYFVEFLTHKPSNDDEFLQNCKSLGLKWTENCHLRYLFSYIKTYGLHADAFENMLKLMKKTTKFIYEFRPWDVKCGPDSEKKL